MRSIRWFVSYAIMTLAGLGLAFGLSLHFLAPAHAQTSPPQAPGNGDLPAEFAEQAKSAPSAAPTASPNPAIPTPVPPVSPANPGTAAAPSAGTPASSQELQQVPLPPPPPPPMPGGSPTPTAATPSTAGNTPGGGEAPVSDGATAPAIPQVSPAGDGYVYDPTGRRDPFKPYRSALSALDKTKRNIISTDPLQKWELERLQVIGILWEVRTPRAMVIDPDGVIHTIFKNTKIGRNNGIVAAIREGEVVVIQTIDNEGTITKETKILELGK